MKRRKKLTEREVMNRLLKGETLALVDRDGIAQSLQVLRPDGMMQVLWRDSFGKWGTRWGRGGSSASWRELNEEEREVAKKARRR